MPYSVFFNGGIAFHQGSLSVESHGCIHLSRGAAETYYNFLSVGDTVQVVS
jgi:lipoprotein-anchoring transpeptidase ErfK/SrfK